MSVSTRLYVKTSTSALSQVPAVAQTDFLRHHSRHDGVPARRGDRAAVSSPYAIQLAVLRYHPNTVPSRLDPWANMHVYMSARSKRTWAIIGSEARLCEQFNCVSVGIIRRPRTRRCRFLWKIDGEYADLVR